MHVAKESLDPSEHHSCKAHIGGHSTDHIGAGLHSEGLHGGGVDDGIRRIAAQSLQSGARWGESELGSHAISVRHDHVDKGLSQQPLPVLLRSLQGGGRPRIRRRLVLLHVEIAHQHNGPGVRPSHVVEVHS